MMQVEKHKHGTTGGAIKTLNELYQALQDEGALKNRAVLMLMLRSWIAEVSVFDPVSGDALSTDLDSLIGKISKSGVGSAMYGETNATLKDRTHRIVAHSSRSLQSIAKHPRYKRLRTHEMMPLHAVRTVDSKTIQWLSRQPGRTLRERVSAKRRIKAVKRISSINTSENRLLKAFLLNLERVLLERKIAIPQNVGDDCNDMETMTHRWLRSDDASTVGAWDRLPPNNTLLQEKNYKKIWDGWQWLQRIDEDIAKDSERANIDALAAICWETLALLNHVGDLRVIQQPVALSYDEFTIAPELHTPKSQTVSGYLLDTNPSSTTPKPATRVVFALTPQECTVEVGESQVTMAISGDTLSVRQQQDADFSLELELELQTYTFREIAKKVLDVVASSYLGDFSIDQTPDTPSPSNCMKSSVIDLYSIRPRFTGCDGSPSSLPFRLLHQSWASNGQGNVVIDCGTSKGITLQSDIETVSMRTLFAHNSELPASTKSSVAMFFAKKLKSHLQTDRLTYLVPDWSNDFDLESIRKSLNSHFQHSSPLPQSIASVFAWQSSDSFMRHRVRAEDLVLVLDSFEGGVSVTPVEPIYRAELENTIPKTRGISWERHPSITIPNSALGKRDRHSGMIASLNSDECPLSEELIQLFGYYGLISDGGKVSFVHEGESWYHLPNTVRTLLNSTLEKRILTDALIADALENIGTNNKPRKVFILPLDGVATAGKIRSTKSKYTWLSSSMLNLKGAQVLSEWQENAGDLDLWRDHLPKLSIEVNSGGRPAKFYLVNEATVTPFHNQAVAIPVEGVFTLPASGTTEYSFPIQQGEGSKRLEFVVHLSLPNEPLKKSMDFDLKMTYTYGADSPYNLTFIPLQPESAGFKSINADWIPASELKESDPAEMLVPNFPPPHNWLEFYKFPKKNSSETSDLIYWISGSLKALERYSGSAIQKERLVKRFKALRFPVLTVWNYGNSLSDMRGIDEESARDIEHSIMYAESLLEGIGESDELGKEIAFILSCLHKDTPELVREMLFLVVNSNYAGELAKYHRNVAFAIGDAKLPWQRELLVKSLDRAWGDSNKTQESVSMSILGIAFWRSEDLIRLMTLEGLETLSVSLYRCIKDDLRENLSQPWNRDRLMRHLELLLALLRGRGNDGEGYSTFLAPNEKLTKQYVDLIFEVLDATTANDIKLESRIDFGFGDDKPEAYHNTPDIIYALYVYLTGDLGKSTITITGSSD